MSNQTNPFRVGDLADHKSGEFDLRRVVAVEGDTIRLDLFGKPSGPLSAANYHRIPASSEEGEDASE